MQAHIHDIHGAHGLTFKLSITPSHENEKEFRDLLRLLRVEFLKTNQSALYSYSLELTDGQVEIGLAEQHKRLAKVDHQWNHSREDQKFVALVTEGDPENEQWLDNNPPHFKCYWCNNEVRSVDRLAIEVYSSNLEKMCLVNVHRQCQEIRERQISQISFATPGTVLA